MGRIAAAAALLLAASACGRSPVGAPTIEDSESDSEAVEDLEPCVENPASCSSTVTLQRGADILFVIDNSGSMGDEQGTLAANFPQFIGVLEDEQVGASYRIGVTTTDQRGLVATSCRRRLGDFVWDGCLGDECFFNDARSTGCLNACSLDEIQIQPTTLIEDGPAIPRPWLEKAGGTTNLPASVSIEQALQCIGPQGLDGSGFEMPLESMRFVLEAERDGFLRDDALLAVIFVTDEADCSASEQSVGLLGSEEGKAFWTMPDRPSSAICWNAGVTCVGGPGTYETCYAADKDWDGQETADADNAVLYKVDRYVDTLRQVGAQKELRGGNGTVLVAVIAGVPEEYPETGVLPYRDSDDPQFNVEYGIGPSCNRGTEAVNSPPGIPPVRLREFAEAFATERRNIFSICSPDYAIALEQIAEEISQLGARSCIPGCAKDVNPRVDGLQPSCRITEQRPDDSGGERPVPPCVVDNEDWEFPSPADNVCFRRLTDPDASTAWTHDDMSPQCVTREANLEFVVERRRDVPVPAGTAVEIECELDGPVGVTCSEL